MPVSDLQLGDIIVQVDDHRVRNSQDLLDYLDAHKVGDAVNITIVRGVGTDSPQELHLKSRLKSNSFE